MLKEMRYVYAVYTERGFGNAAKSLFVTQPVVSNMVKRAEKEYNAKIFDRSTSPISLTTAGIRYIKALEQIMQVEAETLSLFNQREDSSPPQIRIASSTFACTYILPTFVKQFQSTLDQYVDVYWREAGNPALLELLMKGEVDFILSVDNYDLSVFEYLDWCHDYLILAVPTNAPINQQLEAYRFTAEDIRNGLHKTATDRVVSIRAFSEMDFITLKDGSDIAHRSYQLCAEAGFTPNVTMKVDQLITAYTLTQEGLGITITSDSIPLHKDGNDNLFFYIMESPPTTRTVKLYSLRSKEKTAAAKAFWEYNQSIHEDI